MPHVPSLPTDNDEQQPRRRAALPAVDAERQGPDGEVRAEGCPRRRRHPRHVARPGTRLQPQLRQHLRLPRTPPPPPVPGQREACRRGQGGQAGVYQQGQEIKTKKK